ncbi:hypothetical protein CRUP_037448, partial [Coryphaenoides rupestris]
MSRSFYVDSLIIKDTVRPAPPPPPPLEPPLEPLDFLIPICASRKSGAPFCVCPVCVTSHHIHHASSRSGGGGGGGIIPLLKGHFPGAEAQYCHRIGHHHHHHHPPSALAHHAPGHHTPVTCTPTPYSAVTDPRYHCLSIGFTHGFYARLLRTVLRMAEVRPRAATSTLQNGKRMRTAFTSTQLLELGAGVLHQHYLSRLRRIEIATYLSLSEKQNRRVKHKKEKGKGGGQRSVAAHRCANSTTDYPRSEDEEGSLFPGLHRGGGEGGGGGGGVPVLLRYSKEYPRTLPPPPPNLLRKDARKREPSRGQGSARVP